MSQGVAGGHAIAVMFLLIISALIIVHADANLHKEMVETNMVLYLHDLLSGKNVTAVAVAGANGWQSNPGQFGTIVVIDDLVTGGPDRGSQQVGRARGIYTVSALDVSDLHFTFSLVFTQGDYKGSTLEIQGADRFLQPKREVSVVSGTDAFRYAKGYAILETQSIDGLNAVVKFTISFIHAKEQGR